MQFIRKFLKISLLGAWLAVMFFNIGLGADAPKQVLFFSKSAGYEHSIAYRETAWPSFLEKEMWKLGDSNNIYFTFTKEGTCFTPENIAKYDAFVFYTSGNLTNDVRDGWGDDYAMMTAAGMQALRQAVHNGKGFMGIHCTIESMDSFSEVNPAPGIVGADYLGHGEPQAGRLIQCDKAFPGMAGVSVDYQPVDQWYALKNFSPDLHVILALDGSAMRGNLYQRPSYPIAWARMEGQGRVYYTAMGHSFGIWRDPVFRQMIVGGVRWVAGATNASITPNLGEATPRASEIPPSARSTAPDRQN